MLVNCALSKLDRRLSQCARLTVRCVLIGLSTLAAIACQTPTSPISQPSTPLTQASAPAPSKTDVTETIQAEQHHYTNDDIGFSFAYPADFVVAQSDSTTEEGLKLTLDLWQQEQYKLIQAGEYEGGTELPPNVQVTVYDTVDVNDNRTTRTDLTRPNPTRTDLQGWVEVNNRFVLQGQFQTQMIAGQEALIFSSDGLYRHQNVVFTSPLGTEIIVISLAQIEVTELDEPNKHAFEQVISTFQFTD